MFPILRRSLQVFLAGFATLLLSSALAEADPAAALVKPGAGSPKELIEKFADAVDGGHPVAVDACIDRSKPLGLEYGEYMHSVALGRGIRLDLGKTIGEKYGAEVAAKAAAMDRASGALDVSYAGLKTRLTDYELKEGAGFSPPGFMGRCVFVKKDGVFLLDGSDVLRGVDSAYLKAEVEKYVKLAQHFRDAAELATSADDLLARLAAVKE